MDHNQVTLPPANDLEHYLREALRFPMLEPAEERRLAERWRADQDPEAAQLLLGSHLRLVFKIARGFRGYGLPLGDLVAEGNVGLMQALSKFEPERGFRFATYAMWWIRAAIQEYVLHNRSLVKMGTTAAQKRLFFNLRRIKAEMGEFGDGDLPSATVASIAAELDVTEDEVIQMNRRLAASDQSLSAPIGADEDTQWQDMLVTERPDQESVLAESSELAWRRELLGKGMEVLNERERHILSERRLRDGPKTLEDLSQVYGVSRERIRQIEVRAFEKLQKAMLGAAASAQGPEPLAA